jgi:NADH-quinone oxidoreductase subunit L
VTRFADLGFLIGILMLAFYAGSLDFETIMKVLRDGSSPQSIAITSASFLGFSALTWALVLVFAGGAGKSAMFPLHIWLPDAMEGPTPVSALIHAATMVVAGVYLVARLFPLFSFNNAALEVVTFIGTLSALLAAFIACTQTDIKRVLAYSTMSQIGYMMFALGVSGYGGEHGLGYTASLFHLFTHAFFKSLLFLCAGAVIHFVHSNDMKDMGRLAKWMPLTHLCFLIACLSIAGVPPFSGFFSKEEILSAAYEHHKFVYVVGVLTAGLTSFYMFRLYFSVFWNKPDKVYDHHAHTGWMMKFALVFLAGFTGVSGFVPFSTFISSDGVPFATANKWMQSLLPVALAITGIATAYFLYFRESSTPEKIAQSFGGIYRTIYRKFYIDELYLFVTRKIIFNGFGRPAAWIDKHVVDGAMNGVAKLTARFSNLIKGFQSGQLQTYVMYFFAGVAGLTLLIIYLWK